MLTVAVGSFNLFLGVFNLVPLLPLDGGYIVEAAWERIRRRIARVLHRPDPGFVDIAKQLPIAYMLASAFFVMSAVLIIGDLVVPLTLNI